MKSTIPTPDQINRQWILIDAEGQVLGRLAARIAGILRGKHKPTYTPFLDTGDFVVVINAEKVAVTGKKLTQKIYQRYSGYPSGRVTRTLGEVLKAHPDRPIRQAVKGMLPDGPLARRQLGKLKIYAGPTHPHAAQQPQPLAAPQLVGLPAAPRLARSGAAPASPTAEAVAGRQAGRRA